MRIGTTHTTTMSAVSEERFRSRDHLGPDLAICGVRDTRCQPSPCLSSYRCTGGHQLVADRGDQRDPGLAGRGLVGAVMRMLAAYSTGRSPGRDVR